jgi:hypothetical protein
MVMFVSTVNVMVCSVNRERGAGYPSAALPA